MSIIENAGMPSLKVTFTGTNDKATFSVNLTNRSNVVIPDYSSVPEFADEETETRNYVQSEVFREYESYTNMNKFTNDVNVKVVSIPIFGGVSDTRKEKNNNRPYHRENLLRKG